MDAQNTKGNTGLHFLYQFGYPEIAEYFIEKGARTDIKNDPKVNLCPHKHIFILVIFPEILIKMVKFLATNIVTYYYGSLLKYYVPSPCLKASSLLINFVTIE